MSIKVSPEQKSKAILNIPFCSLLNSDSKYIYIFVFSLINSSEDILDLRFSGNSANFGKRRYVLIFSEKKVGF